MWRGDTEGGESSSGVDEAGAEEASTAVGGPAAADGPLGPAVGAVSCKRHLVVPELEARRAVPRQYVGTVAGAALAAVVCAACPAVAS